MKIVVIAKGTYTPNTSGLMCCLGGPSSRH